jgi:voltage-gated potassium channel
VDERARKWEQRFEWPMVIAALLVIPVLVIEESNPGEPLDTIGQILNWGTWLAFVVEAVVMIHVTPRDWEWIKRHPIDLAVIFLSPPFIGNSLAAARLFRLLRVLRLLRIFSMRRLLSLQGIKAAGFIAAFLILVGGASYAAIEKTTPDGEPLTAWDGIWWAITTVTTVGYGDTFPTTDLGRAIAVIVMLAGIGFVALLTAFVADRFIREDDEAAATVARQIEIIDKLDAVSERLERVERELNSQRR